MKLITSILALALPGAIVAQTGDYHFVHGLPGATVDVQISGPTSSTFSNVNFGDVETTALPPGSYTIDVVAGGTVVLSSTAIIAADASVTSAAHLQLGGTSTISTFDNDISPVTVAGEARHSLRHYADAGFVVTQLDSPIFTSIGFLDTGNALYWELPVNTYDVRAATLASTPAIPLPASATLNSSQFMSDMSYEIYLVGTPGTASFTAIVQELSLPPAQPNNPTLSDLTVTGSLIGGTIQAGGDLIYDVVGATPNELMVICLSDSDVPLPSMPSLPFLNIPLGIGGGGSLFFRSYGTTDASGTFNAVDTFAPIGGMAFGFTLDLYAQAVTLVNAPTISLVASSISDVESFQVSF